MKKFFLLFPALVLAVVVNAAIPELTKSTPLTLTAESEGFVQSENANELEDGVWINWPGGTIHEGFAKWSVNIVDPGVYTVTLDMKCDNTYKFRACVIDPETGDTIAVGRTAKVHHGEGYANATEDCGQFNLFAREAGEYIIALTDTIQWSEGKVRGMTLSYLNGALTTAPATLIPDDALLSARAWIDKSGAVDSILFTPRGSEGHNLEEWVKWAVEISEPGYYDFTANTYRAGSQKFEITLLNQNESETLISNDNGGSSIGSGNRSISTGKINLAKGIYVLRVRNIYNYAESRLLNAVVTYKGGKAVEVPGTLNIDDVILSDEAWVDRTGEVDSILFTARGSEGHNSANWAKWKVKVTDAGYYNFTANVYRKDGSQKYEIKLFNSDESVEVISNANTSMPTGNASISTGNVNLSEGIYVIRIRNTYDYAKSRLLNVVCTQSATVAIPATLTPTDAILSPRAWVDNTGAVDSILYTPRGAEGHNSEEWVKWQVNVTTAGNYNFIANVCRPNGSQKYEIKVLNSDESAELISNTDESMPSGDATISSGSVNLAVGKYVVLVRNIYDNAESRLLNVLAKYAGGATIDVPATLMPVDAMLSDRAWVDNTGAVDSILFTPRGYEGYNDQEWAKWKINVNKAGVYNFTANVCRPNGSQKYEIKVLNSDESTELISNTDESMPSGDQSISTGNVALETGIHYVKVRNIYNHAESRLLNVVATYLGGARATLPATLDADDALFSEKAYAEGGEIYFSPNPGSQNVYGEWAKWNVNVPATGTFLFTMAVTSTNSQTYKITILDGENEVDSYEKHPSSGDQTIKHYFNLAAGNYAVKVENTYSWSNGHVVSLVVTQPELIVLDEAAETNAVIHDNYRNGNHDIQIIRSIVPGMYNTICLPFDVSSSKLQTIFGSDVELLQMSGATLNGNELDLNFETATSIYRGTPYLIKTSKAVVNPVFTEVEIKAEDGDATGGEGFDVDFIGSFINTTIEGNTSNLYLGANDKLYFSENDVTMKGMRAYFHVKISNALHVIQHARIVTKDHATTAIDEVSQEPKSQKLIINGQLIIIRDGVRYNVMGAKIQ